jgi:hypothetical protein
MKKLWSWLPLVILLVAAIVAVRGVWTAFFPHPPALIRSSVPAATLSGEFPCVYAIVRNGQVSSQLGTCSMPLVRSGPVDRFETDLRYGRFVMRQTDLLLDDTFKVPLTRTYASDDWIPYENRVHAFGRNANHPFDIALLGSRNPYTYVMLALEDSDFIYFDRISAGTGYQDAVYQHTETATKFYKAEIKWNGNGWTTRLEDGSQIFFPESYNGTNAAQGAAAEIRDSTGNRLILHRDRQRNLTEIETPHGHWIRLKTDGQARIFLAEDDHGNWTSYQYSTEGMLAQASSSSGEVRNYVYDGTLMTQVLDGHGRVLVRNWYDDGLLKKQQFGDGSVYLYNFESSPGGRCRKTATVTLPGGVKKRIEVESFVPAAVKRGD